VVAESAQPGRRRGCADRSRLGGASCVDRHGGVARGKVVIHPSSATTSASGASTTRAESTRRSRKPTSSSRKPTSSAATPACASKGARSSPTTTPPSIR
jgi:hypothetical protein